MILTIFHRDIGDKLWKMTTTLRIQADLLKNTGSIPYKYVVHADNISEFECLHGAPDKGNHYVNRCLIIPTASFQRGGMGCIRSTNMLRIVMYMFTCTYSFAIFMCTYSLLVTNQY